MKREGQRQAAEEILLNEHITRIFQMNSSISLSSSVGPNDAYEGSYLQIGINSIDTHTQELSHFSPCSGY